MEPEVQSLPLRDIHLPDPISWWPPAPGWWVLLALVLLLVIAYFIHRRHKKLRLLRVEALAEVAKIRDQHIQRADPARVVNELSALLRRISVTVFPDQDIASLTGTPWLQFLDSVMSQATSQSTSQSKRKAGALQHRFETGLGELFVSVQYQKNMSDVVIPVDDLFELCSDWIKALPLVDPSVLRERGR